jgi:nitrite reductase/ring-hydroxylating ferredoxin subunit
LPLLVLGDVKDFPSGKMRSFRIGDREVAVASLRDRFYAFANECTHQHQYLTDGFLEGGNVVCAYHEATYDLATGALLFGPALEDIAIFPVHVAGEQLTIEWPEALAQEAVVPVDYEEGRLQREQMMM